MPNHRGNPGNKGNTKPGPRTGRRSAFQQLARPEVLYEMFFREYDIDELRDKIKSGVYSVKDIFLYKALSGSDRAIIALFNKVFPNNINIQRNIQRISS